MSTDPKHPGRFTRILFPSPPDPDEVLTRYAKALSSPGSQLHLVRVAATPVTNVPSIPTSNIHLRQGDPLDQVLACAAEIDADLIVTPFEPADNRRNFARRLAMKAPCSVLSAPAGSHASITRILAPVDFSPQSADALAAAAEIAFTLGIPSITAMHIYFDESVVTYRGHAAVLEHKEEGAFEKFLAGVDLRGVAVETLLEESSSVPHAIHRAVDARGFDLVVMGTRGRSASAAVLLGSETDHMLQECPMPLLAVKHFGARLGVLEALLDKRFRRRDTPHFG